VGCTITFRGAVPDDNVDHDGAGNNNNKSYRDDFAGEVLGHTRRGKSVLLLFISLFIIYLPFLIFVIKIYIFLIIRKFHLILHVQVSSSSLR